jgi:hypothetical protein
VTGQGPGTSCDLQGGLRIAEENELYAAIFANPPYSKARERWVRRCIQVGADGRQVVLLIPAATDTQIFQEAPSTAAAVVFIRGRLKFGVPRPNRRQAAASHPSALLAWNVVDLTPCAHRGVRLAGGAA